jgi:hypothetical protein
VLTNVGSGLLRAGTSPKCRLKIRAILELRARRYGNNAKFKMQNAKLMHCGVKVKIKR